MPRGEGSEGMDREWGRRLQRLERNARIGRKSRLLARLDPNREAVLEGTFTDRVADAVSARGPTERQREVDEAAEAYEDALDSVLTEILKEPAGAKDVVVGGGQAMIEEGEQQAAVGAFLLAHEGHTGDVEVQIGAWTVYCRCARCDDARVFEVDNEARERALGLPPWPEDDEERPA